ncbi:chitin synthase-domain-containing protein [Phycomyces blakesleeanus]
MPTTYRGLIWTAFARVCTLPIPDVLLHSLGGMTTPGKLRSSILNNNNIARRAWREKIAICILFLIVSCSLAVWLEFVSELFCDPEKTYDYDEVYGNGSRYVGINGKAVRPSKNMEMELMSEIQNHLGQDISPLFPTFLHLRRSSQGTYDDKTLQLCLSGREAQADAWLSYLLTNDPGYIFANTTLITCPNPAQLNISGSPCFLNSAQSLEVDMYGLKGDIVFDLKDISTKFNALPTPANPDARAYVVLNGNVLDLTSYFTMATNVVPVSTTTNSRAFAPDRLFLPLDLSIMLYVNLGKDMSDYFNGNVSSVFNDCLKTLFFKGVVSSAIPVGCSRINPAMWATMGIGLMYFLLKMNLANLSRMPFIQRLFFSSDPKFSSARPRSWPHTILMIPCCGESNETLKQTYESLARASYEDTKKLLLFVCDGVTQSVHDSKETHVLILEALGYSCTEEPAMQAYVSLGQNRRRLNYARVYSGFYETGRNRVPYMVVVKHGHPREHSSSSPGNISGGGNSGGRVPGNRGKRDSMIIVFGFLERCMNITNNRMTPLEYELFNQCYNVLGIDPRLFKYLLVTDADTQVHADVVQRLVLRLERDPKMIAISGHIRPANPEQNLTTMLQIFPLYLTLFSGLAYETFLKRVMTISSGLVMYKVWSDSPLLSPSSSPSKSSPSLSPSQPRSRSQSQSRSQSHSRSRNTSMERTQSKATSQQSIWPSRWPKLSDEIIPNKDPWDVEETQTSANSSMAEVRSSRPVHTTNISLCCIHPTVLRGFALQQASTMHTMNALLQGEDRCLAAVLLQSHPGCHLGFESEAIGYVTLPTDFLALQGSQTRSIRAIFYNLWRNQRVYWQRGLSYWLLSITELLDMIFYTPVIVYLYIIYVRFFLNLGLTYSIIAFCFTGLVIIHIIYFLLRRQFRYVLWFILYCLIAVPLFAIWFPLLAAWNSNNADKWYDVWAIRGYKSSRLHGIVDYPNPKDSEKDEEVPDEGELIPRMRLTEHEAFEARKSHQRNQTALDSKFVGFSSFANSRTSTETSAPSRRSESMYDGDSIITSPPNAQIRDGFHSSRMAATSGFRMAGSTVDGYGYGNQGRAEGFSSSGIGRRDATEVFKTGMLPPYRDHANSSVSNPFIDPVDNPFEDDYESALQSDKAYVMDETTYRNRNLGHRQSRSQSSYFTQGGQRSAGDQTPYASNIYSCAEDSVINGTVNSSGFTWMTSPYVLESASHSRAFSVDSVFPADVPVDRRSIRSTLSTTYSLASSNLSVDPEMSLETIQAGVIYSRMNSKDALQLREEQEQGRRAAMHGRVGLRIPRSSAHIGSNSSGSGSGSGSGTHGIGSGSGSGFSAAIRSRTPRPNFSQYSTYSHHRSNTVDTMDTITTNNTNPEQQQPLSSHEFFPLLRQQIRLYLDTADLDSTTRAQVKDHLFHMFGSRVHTDDETQAYIHQCIEETTLEYLDRIA